MGPIAPYDPYFNDTFNAYLELVQVKKGLDKAPQG